jgi:MarR family transcriptional regulator for hemolysin
LGHCVARAKANAVVGLHAFEPAERPCRKAVALSQGGPTAMRAAGHVKSLEGSRATTVVQMLDQNELIHPQAAVAPGYLANHAARVFNRLVDAELRPHGVSLALIGPIMLLSWKGPMLQRDLVIASAVKQPAMVALLDKLEGLKLIKRTPTPQDRRAALVALTARGRAIADVGSRALLGMNAVALEGFSEDEIQQTVAFMHRLIANMERCSQDV